MTSGVNVTQGRKRTSVTTLYRTFLFNVEQLGWDILIFWVGLVINLDLKWGFKAFDKF